MTSENLNFRKAAKWCLRPMSSGEKSRAMRCVIDVDTYPEETVGIVQTDPETAPECRAIPHAASRHREEPRDEDDQAG